MVRRQAAAVQRYIGQSGSSDEDLADVLGWLDQLSGICSQPASASSFSVYLRASALLRNLNDFLDLMNEDRDARFEQSEVGRIWALASDWRQEARLLHQTLTRDQVWNWIAPAVPDTLTDLGGNVFEAKWAAPVPEMDIELLRGAEGVRILGEAFEPAHMPDGIGLRFTIDN